MPQKQHEKDDELYEVLCMNEFLAKAVTSDLELSEREDFGLKCLFDSLNRRLAGLAGR